ncbi:hypothetical protein ABCV69_004529 [Pseudomonas aeruginosa]|uniref:hypothetical protein n=1 Tax=Pseudomonas aeruginosa TaxID=287 RepID=UPI0005B4922F|nr:MULTISPECIES: hypothetical protein [Pseudomonadaceae]EKY4114769.1 hypothetical protein [Pseudomonas aeruginosa]ELJ2278689.1 hypothetical protein [Pseudomonas aeruginosa]KJS79024.1 MAG: hypothetical protein JL55_13450 [[Pseudomonas] sp. BICA1-14]MBS2052355.1 hypothetical protein [Pseudomonas aeruginosa]HBP0221235.1 hypothetical protein [Pseudomonas aeruginosa]
MHEPLTKTEFINALVREHVAIHQLRQSLSRDTNRGYLSIELTCKGRDSQECRLIIRGNRVGTHWMILDTGLPHTPEGIRKAHHLASDLALAAVTKIADKLGEPASIVLPEVSFFRPWFTERVTE